MIPDTGIGNYSGEWDYSVSQNGFMTTEIFLEKFFFISQQLNSNSNNNRIFN